MSKTHRVLFIDDERELIKVQGVRYREMVGLRAFSTAEKEVLWGHPQIDVARNYDEAIAFLSTNKYDMVLFDHDLGPGKNGMDIAKWVVQNIKEPFLHYAHSANAIGRINIDSLIGQYFDSLRRLKIPALIESYKNKTRIMSGTHQKEKIPEYTEIVKLGVLAIPFILKDMEETGSDWHPILVEITKNNPISEEIAGQIPEIVKVWCDFLNITYETYLSLHKV